MRLEDSTNFRKIKPNDYNELFRRANTQSKKKRSFNKPNGIKLDRRLLENKSSKVRGFIHQQDHEYATNWTEDKSKRFRFKWYI